MTKTITADATGTEATAVGTKTIITTTATVALVWMRTMSIQMLIAKKIVPCINGKEMGDVTTKTMFVVVTGTAETAVDTKRAQMRSSMAIVRSVSAATRLYPKYVMANARCSSGVETATAMTVTITADVIGTAETVVDKQQLFHTVTNAVAKIRTTRALCAPNPVTRVPGSQTKHVMTKIITVVVLGTVATVAAPPKITTSFTAPSVSV